MLVNVAKTYLAQCFEAGFITPRSAVRSRPPLPELVSSATTTTSGSDRLWHCPDRKVCVRSLTHFDSPLLESTTDTPMSPESVGEIPNKSKRYHASNQLILVNGQKLRHLSAGFSCLEQTHLTLRRCSASRLETIAQCKVLKRGLRMATQVEQQPGRRKEGLRCIVFIQAGLPALSRCRSCWPIIGMEN